MKTLILLITLFSSAIYAGEVTRFELMQFEKNCINDTIKKEHQEWCSKNSWMIKLVEKNVENQAEREFRQYK